MAPTLDASFTLPAATLAVRAARSAVDDVLRGVGVRGELARDIRLCVSEAVTNAIRHGYDGAAGAVEIEVLHDAGEVTVVVRDRGRGVSARTPSDVGGYGLASSTS